MNNEEISCSLNIILEPVNLFEENIIKGLSLTLSAVIIDIINYNNQVISGAYFYKIRQGFYKIACKHEYEAVLFLLSLLVQV